MKKTISRIINIILLAILGYLLLNKFVINKPKKQIDIQQLVVKDLDGNIVEWTNLENEGIFLNFWASWCGPCMAEMPSIKSSMNHFEEKPINYLLVNTQGKADAVKISQSEKYQDMPFYYLESAGDIEIHSIPLTYLINSKGEVKKVHAGLNHWNTPITQKQISKLLP